MGYYLRTGYRSWRSRGYRNNSSPPQYSNLTRLFGGGVSEIRNAFLHLKDDALNELMSDYGARHGHSAESYARKTFSSWKVGLTGLSGRTMERLIELVPPYLSPDQRFQILQSVLKRHKKSGPSKTIRINVKEPAQGFSELQQALSSMSHDDVLAHLPEHVMKAASWLYDDDITASRAMLAEVERRENDLIRSNAAREIQLLRKTIATGQVKSASYSVEMPSGKLDVVAYTPSMCFIATICFGEEAEETKILRNWRDAYLIETAWGRKFIVWYYNNGELLAEITSRSHVLKAVARTCIGLMAKIVHQKGGRNER